MKKAINAWTIPENVSFADMFRDISGAGFDGIELNIDAEQHSAHSLSLQTDHSTLLQLRQLSQDFQLPICSISTSLYGGTLGANDAQTRAEGQRILEKQLECASTLGADGILVVPGGISESLSIRQAYENVQTALSALLPVITRTKIAVGLENVWNGFFASPMDMARFIDAFDCSYIGAYFDVGNVVVASDPEHWIEILGRRIVKIHVKDFQRASIYRGTFVNLLEGSIRWQRVIPALRAAGYDGYLTAELSSMPLAPEHLYHSTCDAL
ncbi:MAG: sugar phosphate isomerase/epimerase family protein, partial [Clostridia bacterium]